MKEALEVLGAPDLRALAALPRFYPDTALAVEAERRPAATRGSIWS